MYRLLKVSQWLKVGGYSDLVSNGFYPDETPNSFASRPNQGYLHIAIFIMVVIYRIRVSDGFCSSHS